MFAEFSAFLKKFNVIPAAIGLVLALAVIPVMEAVVNVIMSLVGKAGGLETDFGAWSPGDVPLGLLINALITFTITAFAVFMVVKGMIKAGADTDAAETPDQALLGEIRDLLRAGR